MTTSSPRRRSLRPLFLAVAGLLLAPLLAPLVAATAAAPVPATPAFSAPVDGYARWEAENTCDPVAKPGAERLVKLLVATYGSSIATNIVRPCSASDSGHEEGRSIDWMTNARDANQKAIGDAFVGWLLAPDAAGTPHAMARRLGIQYLIWDSRKFYLFNPSAGWTEYSNCVTVRTGASDDNTCHRNHVHISMGWAGARAQTTWFTSQIGSTPSTTTTPATTSSSTTSSTTSPSTPTTTTAPPPPADCPTSTLTSGWAGPTGSGLGYVQVPPTRVLDTRTLGCLLPAKGRMDVKVTGTGGLPTSGVAAVTVQLTGVRAAGRSWLVALPAGMPAGETGTVGVAPGATTSALATIPVGVDGRISVVNGPAAMGVTVDVIGYYPSDGSGARYRPESGARVLDATASGWSTAAVVPPVGARYVVGSVSVVRPEFEVGAALGDGSTAVPAVSAMPGEVAIGRAIAPVGATIGVRTDSPTRRTLDVTGWFGTYGAEYTPLAPQRVINTWAGRGAVPLQPGVEQTVQLGGAGGVPADAAVVAVSFVVSTGQPGYAMIWTPGQPRPMADLQALPEAPRVAYALVTLDAQGRATMMSTAAANVAVDVLGYYR